MFETRNPGELKMAWSGLLILKQDVKISYPASFLQPEQKVRYTVKMAIKI